jgi:hypothetical protein
MPREEELLAQNIAKTSQSSFFHGEARTHPVALHRSKPTHSVHHQQPEQIVSGMDRWYMEPQNDIPPMSQSLNSLSFTQEPYTQANKPVYARPAPQTLLSRATLSQNNSFTSRPNQHHTCLRDPQFPASSASAAPSDTQSMLHIPSRRTDVQIDAFRGVKGGSVQEPAYKYQPGTTMNQFRFPYHHQQDLNTAGGRRSVRR